MGQRRARVLAVHRYYWPDSPPYASILRLIAEAWADQGWAVDVLASQPSYKSNSTPTRPRRERLGGVSVSRLKLRHEQGRPLRRVLNSLRLSASIMWRSATGKYDVVMVSTMPPVIPGLAARLGTRVSGAKLVYHCMDLHPEIGRISGEFAHNRLYRVLRRQDALTCAGADVVVVLSGDMEDSVRARPGCSDATVRVMNNFALPAEDGQQSRGDLPPTNKIRLVFAGNMGRFQGLDVLVEAAHRLVSSGFQEFEFVFMGTGSYLERLRSLAVGPGSEAIRFLPHQSVGHALATIRACDVGVVSLVPDIYRFAYPSKTITYLELGKPLLAVVEYQSQLAAEVRSEGIGWTAEPANPEGIASEVRAIVSARERLPAMGRAAATYARQVYNRDAILAEWVELLSWVNSGDESA